MERITRFRVTVMTVIIMLVLGFYTLRLFDIQIIETKGDTDNITTFTTMTRVKAARGDILDRNGNVLVGNRASYDLIINHFVLTSSEDPNGSIYRLVKLCEEMGIEYNEHFPVTMTRPFTYTLETQNDTWKGYFQTYLSEQGNLDSDITAPLLIKQLREDYNIPEEWSDEEARKVIGIRYELRLRGLTTEPTYVFLNDATDKQLSAILETNVPGMNVEASTVREYHTDAAAHIIGYVGKMDESQWEHYGELGYSMDAEVGQAGVEAVFEEYLRGMDGWRIDVVTTDGTIIESYYEDDQAPQAGKNVELTIDINLQEVTEEALADRIKTLKAQPVGADGKDAEGAAAVVMNVKTGEVLAMASYPTFSLATMWEDYDQILEAEYDPLFNRAIDAAYPPGSTYKMSMIVAGIDSKTIDSQTIIEDTGKFEKYGDILYCSTYTSTGGATDGDVSPTKGLTVSCNVFFYTLADMLSIETMDTVAKSLGLGEPTGIELPEEIGHRSNPDTRKELYIGEDTIWYDGHKIQTGIGQGDNAFTPLQLCVYASTVANKGTRMKATILKRVVSTDYSELVVENQPQIMSTMEISDEAYYTILEGMNGVVKDREGTAWDSFNKAEDLIEADVSPYVDVICAKTGTSQHGTSSVNSDHGSFVAFAPMNDPEIAIAMYGEKVGHGYSMARATRTVLEYYLGGGEAADVEIFENRPG